MEDSVNPTRRLTLGASLLCVVAAVVPYLGVLDAPFVFDDVKLVQENTLLRSGWDDPQGVLATFNITSRRWEDDELRPNYRPMRFLSYLVDAGLSRLVFGGTPEDAPPPFFFHLSNVLLHALNALLVFVSTRRLLAYWGTPGGSVFLPLFAGLLFALHPLQTEAVTYVSGRRDVLSTFFFFAALALYLGPALTPHRRDSLAGFAGALSLVSVALCFVAGLLSKEMVVTLPAVVLLVELLRGGRPSSSRVLLQLVLWGLALGHTYLNLSGGDLVATQLPSSSAAESWNSAGLWSVTLTACRYIARYFALFLLPVSQSIDYSFAAIPLSSGWRTPWTTLPALLFVLVAVGLATWGLVLGRTRSSTAKPGHKGKVLLAFGIFWFLGTLVPVLQFVPIAERFAERFAYLPSFGFVLLAAAALDRLRRFENLLGWGIAGVLSFVLVVATVDRNRDWHSPLQLWTAAVEAQPRAARAHLGRASALKTVGRLDEAAREYTTAIEIFEEAPELPLHHGYILQGLTFRGRVYALLADKDPTLLAAATEDYRRVLSLKDTDGVAIDGSPKHTVLHLDLAGFLLRAGKREEAKAEYERVVEIGSPKTLVAAAHFYLARIALAEEAGGVARELYGKALAETPKDDPAFFTVSAELVQLLIGQKKYDAVWEVAEAALATDLNAERRLHLLMRLAEVTDRRGDFSGTIERLKAILDEDPSYVSAHLTLAGIEANLEHYDSAEKHYREVLRQAPAHAEALRGLQALELRRRAESNGEKTDPRERELTLLRGLLANGRACFERQEYIAAGEVFTQLKAKADALGDEELRALAYSEWARLQDKLGKTQVAASFYDKALHLRPEHAEVLLRMGDLQLRLGKRALAREFYERYVKTEPKETVPRVYFHLANLVGREDPKSAVNYCRRARAAGFDSFHMDRSLGYFYAALEDWEKALESFTRYLERAPETETAEKASVSDYVKTDVLPRVLEN